MANIVTRMIEEIKAKRARKVQLEQEKKAEETRKAEEEKVRAEKVQRIFAELARRNSDITSVFENGKESLENTDVPSDFIKVDYNYGVWCPDQPESAHMSIDRDYFEDYPFIPKDVRIWEIGGYGRRKSQQAVLFVKKKNIVGAGLNLRDLVAEINGTRLPEQTNGCCKFKASVSAYDFDGNRLLPKEQEKIMQKIARHIRIMPRDEQKKYLVKVIEKHPGLLGTETKTGIAKMLEYFEEYASAARARELTGELGLANQNWNNYAYHVNENQKDITSAIEILLRAGRKDNAAWLYAQHAKENPDYAQKAMEMLLELKKPVAAAEVANKIGNFDKAIEILEEAKEYETAIRMYEQEYGKHDVKLGELYQKVGALEKAAVEYNLAGKTEIALRIRKQIARTAQNQEAKA